VYLSLPALLFRAMTQVDLTHMAHWGFVGAFAGGIAVTFLASFIGARRSQRALTDRGIQGLAASYANAGYMGIPLCLALLGPDSMAPATFTTLLTASVLFGFAIALIEFDRQQTPNLSLTLLKVGRALLRNPLLAAPLLGLAWAFIGLALPEGVDRYVALLGASASPCALVTIGLFLAQTETSSSGPGVMRLVAGKLLLQPAVTAVLAFYVFAMPPVWAWTAVLMSALPIGTGPFMLAQMYGRDARVTSRAILVSTVASVLTVSLLVAWISAHPIS
jgi:predicted permease